MMKPTARVIYAGSAAFAVSLMKVAIGPMDAGSLAASSSEMGSLANRYAEVTATSAGGVQKRLRLSRLSGEWSGFVWLMLCFRGVAAQGGYIRLGAVWHQGVWQGSDRRRRERRSVTCRRVWLLFRGGVGYRQMWNPQHIRQ